jgi:transcriptional regulator with XRE-family HTH domain
MMQQLRKYRERAGLTQKELGALLGVAPLTVASWERGRREPPLSRLPAIARAVRCRSAQLIDSEPPRLAGSESARKPVPTLSEPLAAASIDSAT